VLLAKNVAAVEDTIKLGQRPAESFGRSLSRAVIGVGIGCIEWQRFRGRAVPTGARHLDAQGVVYERSVSTRESPASLMPVWLLLW